MKRLWRTEPERSGLGLFCVLPLALMAGGCAVATPVSITSTNGRLPVGAAVDVAPYEADGSLRGNFGLALADALEAHSIATAPGAPLIAEFAIASRPADAGVADPAGSSADSIAWESRPRARGWIDRCDATRLRGTLLLLDRAEGTIRYRGVAESDDCADAEPDLADMADALVRDALGDPERL